MALTIRTNNVPRDIQYEKPEWSDDIEECFDYKGERYWLSEFMRTDGMSELKGWDGYMNDSFFSGIVIRYPRSASGACETDGVIVGMFCS